MRKKTGKYVKCRICKKEFYVRHYRINEAKYCSFKCYWQSKKGKIVHCQKGFKHSEATKKKMRLAHKNTPIGSKNWNWKGGKHTSRGYIFIRRTKHPFNNNGYVPEHRLIIEQQIGHYLLPTEISHHLGAKDDNRPQMLMAFISISTHQRFHKDPNLVKPSEIIFDGRQL